VRHTLKQLMVGTAAALLAAGCGSTRSADGGAVVGGNGPTASAASLSATVYSCDRQPVARPTSYILTCGDGGVALDQLAWSAWGAAQATATGVQVQNSCTPSCAAGSPISAKATVTLSGLSGGHYTKLQVVTAKGTSSYTIDAAGPVVTGAR
jgi:hypothetical protein